MRKKEHSDIFKYAALAGLSLYVLKDLLITRRKNNYREPINKLQVLGHQNNGACIIGNENNGHRILGNNNRGNGIFGSYNIGNNIYGFFNTNNDSIGCFNTKKSYIYLFNKPSKLTMNEWLNSDVYELLKTMPYPPGSPSLSADILPNSAIKANQGWYDRLLPESQQLIIDTENFDANTFAQITGIKISSLTPLEDSDERLVSDFTESMFETCHVGIDEIAINHYDD